MVTSTTASTSLSPLQGGSLPLAPLQDACLPPATAALAAPDAPGGVPAPLRAAAAAAGTPPLSMSPDAGGALRALRSGFVPVAVTLKTPGMRKTPYVMLVGFLCRAAALSHHTNSDTVRATPYFVVVQVPAANQVLDGDPRWQAGVVCAPQCGARTQLP